MDWVLCISHVAVLFIGYCGGAFFATIGQIQDADMHDVALELEEFSEL